MLQHIRAKFSCDNCNKGFIVTLDHTAKLDADEAVFDAAEYALKSAATYEDGEARGTGSIQNGQHLCAKCTRRKKSSGRVKRY